MSQYFAQRNELGANSYLVAGDRGTAVVDPGWYPSEIAALQRRVTATPAGRATHVVLTHGHPDHVAGWAAFPGAILIADPSILKVNDWTQARAFISGMYLRAGIQSAPEFAMPQPSDVAAPPESLDLGGVTLRFSPAPWHSEDSLLITVPELKLIIGGDFISAEQGWPPVLRTTLADYLCAATEVKALCSQYGIEQWLPGHGPLFKSLADLIARLEADHSYLTRLFAGVFAARTAGYTLAEVEERMRIFHHAGERLADRAIQAHLLNTRILYSNRA